MEPAIKITHKQAVVAAVQLPHITDLEFEASLTELRELAKTLGLKVINTFTQRRIQFDTTAYLGEGKRQEISQYVNGETDPDVGRIDFVLVDHDISPSQARNLENELNCSVMDRTMVILEIFHRNARSNAAKTQVEIARLGYMAPRLRELAKLAGPQGRQRSGVGGRGAGESGTELDRRKIRDRIAELQRDIVAMDEERQVQKARRQDRRRPASVALVGYTNAGKSTLMRALTGSGVLVANKLFATLDTTVRALHPESVPHVLVSDTVGFIKNLPHGLVASFKSTLDEALDASLLLHVIDASDPGYVRQIEVTDEVLEQIGAHQIPRIRVFNKIDHVGDLQAQAHCTEMLRAQYPDCVVMSAHLPQDISTLHQSIVAFFQKDLITEDFFLSWSQQQWRGELYTTCKVLEERSDDAGTFFLVKSDAGTLQKLREQLASNPDDVSST